MVPSLSDALGTEDEKVVRFLHAARCFLSESISSRSVGVMISLKTGLRFLSQRAVCTGPQQASRSFSDIKEKRHIL